TEYDTGNTSMADNPRYRSHRAGESRGREEGSGAGLDRKTAGGDPLAELARLIGQEDALEHSMAPATQHRDPAPAETGREPVSAAWAGRSGPAAAGSDNSAVDAAGRGSGREDMRRSDSFRDLDMHGKRPGGLDGYAGEPHFDSDSQHAESRYD